MTAMSYHPPPRTLSHECAAKPSALLALICLAIVHRRHPAWLAVDIAAAARGEQLSAERVSRLCARALGGFEHLVATLSRIGRPPADPAGDRVQAQESAIRSALLDVARTILAHVSLRSGAVRALVVGAWLRLSREHPALTQARFCHALALSPRTFRSWLLRMPAPAASPVAPTPAPAPAPRRRPPRRPRFAFELTVPDTQIGSDTTDLLAFAVPLKLMAAQDIGGRDRALFDAVLVDDHERAALVSRVITEAVAARSGMQVLTDQGTPYMAAATADTLEQLAAEHAPQREGHPQGKATVERAFLSAKACAQPLLDITNRIARALPELVRTDLAKAFTTIVLTATLRAYQLGARAARRADTARAGIDPRTLDEVARRSREQAHAEDRSTRLLLEHIHQAYGLNRSCEQFVRTLRRFPLPVLRQAERQFLRQVHRGDLRDRASYFAAIVRRCHDAFRAEQARRDRQREQDQQLAREIAEIQAHRAARRADPCAWLRDALDILAQQWSPQRQHLLFGGIGPGRLGVRDSIARLAEIHGPQVATDIATAVLRDFCAARADHLGPAGSAAIETLLRQFLPPIPNPSTTPTCAASFASTILGGIGQTVHPPPR